MYHGKVLERLLQFVSKHELLWPGDRVTVAVSGGADSVALLRLLLEARSDLGIVLSVAHFNHKIRGSEADTDEAFVRELAARYDLPFHANCAETPQFARAHHLGLEAAARQLRHEFFRELIWQNKANKVATAHTLDDQAETVLLRLMRGAGTKGLAGIHPRLSVNVGSIVRPLLTVRRAELRSYLELLAQPWREDVTNSDLSFTRNRVRHRLLPLIESEFGTPALERLAETAEIARAEEEYWLRQIGGCTSASELPGSGSLHIPALLSEPLALRRRLVRAQANALGHSLDFHHVEQVLALAQRSHGKLALPNGLKVIVEGKKLLFSTSGEGNHIQPFSYTVVIPGEVQISELNCGLRFTLVSGAKSLSSYDYEHRLSANLAGTDLVVRNWRPGDRFWPLHSKSDKKVKELLTPNRVPARQRSLWPVAERQGEILWVRGLPVSHRFCARDEQSAIVVEEIPSCR